MSLSTPRFELLDHTADVKVRAYGRDLKEAFAAAAWAMFALMMEPQDLAEREERSVAVSGDGYQELLVSWLNELLFLLDAEGLAFRRFHVSHLSPSELRATVAGERLDPGRHRVHGTTVKAATYHQVMVHEGDPCIVEVILDV